MIRFRIDQLSEGLRACYLFVRKPTLYFYPEVDQCDCCANQLIVHKTSHKTVVTLNIGAFEAIETQKKCRLCQIIYRSDELRSLTPHGGRFGFDIIEFIGTELFIHSRNEAYIQSELAYRNVTISKNEISFLGKRFIVYLMLAHQDSNVELKYYMDLKGGYVLHMDGTCEVALICLVVSMV